MRYIYAYIMSSVCICINIYVLVMTLACIERRVVERETRRGCSRSCYWRCTSAFFITETAARVLAGRD